MGLAQREIEAAGIATITLSPIAEVTASVGAPRVAAIEHPSSQLLGAPRDRETQRAVLRALLQAAKEIERPGGVRHLPFRWTKGPRHAAPREPAPIVQLLKKRPWLYARLLTGKIPPHPAAQDLSPADPGSPATGDP